MNQRVGVSELRRRPMQIIRESQDSPEGTTITCRGVPVAVLRGWTARPEWLPDLETRTGWGDAGRVPGETAEETDAVLDSASWGLWEGLTGEQQRALLRAIGEQGHEANAELA
jgi:hypothetical protein